MYETMGLFCVDILVTLAIFPTEAVPRLPCTTRKGLFRFVYIIMYKTDNVGTFYIQRSRLPVLWLVFYCSFQCICQVTFSYLLFPMCFQCKILLSNSVLLLPVCSFPGNILLVHDSEVDWHLRPIDFEYSSYNYR